MMLKVSLELRQMLIRIGAKATKSKDYTQKGENENELMLNLLMLERCKSWNEVELHYCA